MKNPNTPQLSLRDSAQFTKHLPSFLPSVKVFLCTFLMAVTTIISHAQPPGTPKDHETLGALEEPQLYSSYYNGAFWTYHFTTDVNNCAQSLTFKTYITITPLTDEGVSLSPIDLTFNNAQWGGDEAVNVALIRQLAGIGSNQAFYLTNISMEVVINGTNTGIAFYPGQNVKISTGLASPCDCLLLYFDWKNHTINTQFTDC